MRMGKWRLLNFNAASWGEDGNESETGEDESENGQGRG